MIRNLQKSIGKAQKNMLHSQKIVVGILGYEVGIGTTHTSLMLATYFAKIHDLTTCYVEYGIQGDIISIAHQNRLDIREEDMGSFYYENITFYPNMKEGNLYQVYNKGYQCIIIDFGNKKQEALKEYMRCDQRYLIGNLREWKLYKFYSYLELFETGDISMEILFPLGTKQEISSFNKTYPKDGYRIPMTPNPFMITEDSVKTWNQIVSLASMN